MYWIILDMKWCTCACTKIAPEKNKTQKKKTQIMYPQRYCRWRFIFLLNILSGILHDSLSGISLGTNLYMLTAAKFTQVSSTFGSILSNIFFGHPLQHFNTICLLAGILLWIILKKSCNIWHCIRHFICCLSCIVLHYMSAKIIWYKSSYLVLRSLTFLRAWPRSPRPTFFWWLNVLRAMPTSFSVFTPPFTSRSQGF